MRLISVLTILFLISSCAHNRIRYVKLGSRQIVQVNHEDKSAKTVETIETIFVSTDSKTENRNSSVEDTEELIDSRLEENDEIYSTTSHNSMISPPDSSVARTPSETKEMYFEAMRAEKNSRTAKNLLAVSFALLIFPGFGFFLSILFFGIGSSLYSKARRSRYNTSAGVAYEESARKWTIAYFVAMVVTILIVAFLITLFFL